MDFDLFKTLDALIDAWCERRALRPLRYLLPAYPAVIAHTDQKFQLLEAPEGREGTLQGGAYIRGAAISEAGT
jgi:hypothetical protein